MRYPYFRKLPYELTKSRPFLQQRHAALKDLMQGGLDRNTRQQELSCKGTYTGYCKGVRA